MVAVPFLKLNNGQFMPQIGYGTWLSKPGVVGQAIKMAIECGYRHIDCAFIYGNQKEIGTALRELFETGVVKRRELFITSKIWNTFHSKERALHNVDMILEELGLDYLDLCLIHWPMGYLESDELFPKGEDGKILLSDIDYLDTWKALEQAVVQKKVRSIGLSNFNSAQIQRVINNSEIKPAVLEAEIHPYLQQADLVKFCHEMDIHVTAYSPLGSLSGDNPFRKANNRSILQDPVITGIAKKYDKSNAQLTLRYAVQRGLCVIPKSLNAQRMVENLMIFNFHISEEDMRLAWTLENGFFIWY